MKPPLHLLLLVLLSCGRGPEEILRSQGRPEPIRCVRQSEHSVVCIDALGINWVCQYSNGGPTDDARCIPLQGKQYPERP